MTIWDTNREKALAHEPISPVTFHDYRALGGVFEDAAAWWRPQLNLADETGDPIRVSAVETTENLFKVLGVQPAIGRGFDDSPEPVRPGARSHHQPSAVADTFWWRPESHRTNDPPERLHLYRRRHHAARVRLPR